MTSTISKNVDSGVDFRISEKGSWTTASSREASQAFPEDRKDGIIRNGRDAHVQESGEERRVKVNNFFECPVFCALPEECTLPSPSYSCEQLGGPSCNHASYLSRLAKNVVQFASQRATRRALHCAQEKHSSKNRNMRKETLSLLGFRARKSKLMRLRDFPKRGAISRNCHCMQTVVDVQSDARYR